MSDSSLVLAWFLIKLPEATSIKTLGCKDGDRFMLKLRRQF